MGDTPNIKVIRKISEVERADWDRLLGQGSPFIKWDWLDSLEQSGCVNEETGWLPHHLIVERGRKIVGGCPMYLKLHSMGEFVFDFEWAEYAHRLGIRYYPKMLVGIPFTPVTGPRFLTDPRENRQELIQLMGRALIQVAEDNKISSVHVNFCLRDEGEALKELGYIPRLGLQASGTFPAGHRHSRRAGGRAQGDTSRHHVSALQEPRRAAHLRPPVSHTGIL
ncbi:MAG: N-acetyltransferase [Deltaproteobacteria bacterium]|nr:N-acetyltransferase [Deltaproteobacteria bacterium]